MRSAFLVAMLFGWAAPAYAQEASGAIGGEEFFEKRIRPVLFEHCYACHSASAKKVKGGLLLDSRAGMLAGGDSGPALTPGHPDKSRLIEAIRYNNVDLKMPPRSKLADGVIADLTAWVAMGAPWPDAKMVKNNAGPGFDLSKRKQEHWAWQPIRVRAVPKVQDVGLIGDIDRYLLARLEEKHLRFAVAADPRTLLRRLSFDIIGLPPTRAEVEEFVRAWDAGPEQRPAAIEGAVDRMLASPRFGERWGRHWLDLVRYAESRGHEFDYTIPNAHHYRDYVIRAFNTDVPYDQLVHEHIAGDLLANPRLHSQGGFNESILGTAFWFLGEETHSPVDLRQDQADRFDNRIDVMTKTFLGMTVACARCHDHKFDAISAKDYYALFGILESSNYRQARFDTMAHHRKIAEQILKLRETSRQPLLSAMALAATPVINKLDAYLLTAAGVSDRSRGLDPTLTKRWQDALAKAVKDTSSPLHAFALAASDRKRTVRQVLEPIVKRWPVSTPLDLKGVDVIVDYRQAKSNEWLPDDATFGPRPLSKGEILLGTSPERPIARLVEQGGAERDRGWVGMRVSAGTQDEPGSLGGTPRAGRTLRTPEFTLKNGKAFALVKGSGMIYAGVGQHIMIAGPLHGGLIRKFDTGGKFQWVAVDLHPYQGQRTHLEFTPKDNTDFALITVVQGANPPLPFVNAPGRELADEIMRQGASLELAALTQAVYFQRISALVAKHDPALAIDEHLWGANWFLQNIDLFIEDGSKQAKQLTKVAGPIIAEHNRLRGQIKLDSRLVPAMQDGSGTVEQVFIRGNPRAPGAPAPRRFLEALAGPQPLPIKRGSGRLELVEQMTNPALNPLITRVYVNRVWHHLFGRGIVASVDNFGVMGEAPTHPELLDYLADRFVKEGWSTKKLIRALVLTRAYQMSSRVDDKTDKIDPRNDLLHRMRLRRLEGEAIRDAILHVSGRLSMTMYGAPVPVYLNPFQDGRGKPASGPLDGDGRRSIYLSVRRNFLSAFLLAFDTPAPFSTVGRRSVSNVPAQALILLNDPFVHQQAGVWATRVLNEKATDADRIRGMYLDAFARPPSDDELQACSAFLGATPGRQRWVDLCHVLYNAKEFYFLN